MPNTRFTPRSSSFMLAGALVVACTATGAAAGADQATVESRRVVELDRFDQLEVSHGFSVRVQQGDEPRVELEVSPELADRVEVEQRGDRVAIGLERSWPGFRTIRNAKLEAVVTVPTLNGLDASGASHVTVGFTLTDEVDIDVSGASHVMAPLDAETARVEASGAAHVELRGKTASLAFDGSGACGLEAAKLTADQARIELSGASRARAGGKRVRVQLSGASQATLTEAERIDAASLSGGSSLRYPKAATVEHRSVTGGSRMVAR